MLIFIIHSYHGCGNGATGDIRILYELKTSATKLKSTRGRRNDVPHCFLARTKIFLHL